MYICDVYYTFMMLCYIYPPGVMWKTYKPLLYTILPRVLMVFGILPFKILMRPVTDKA